MAEEGRYIAFWPLRWVWMDRPKGRSLFEFITARFGWVFNVLIIITRLLINLPLFLWADNNHLLLHAYLSILSWVVENKESRGLQTIDVFKNLSVNINRYTHLFHSEHDDVHYIDWLLYGVHRGLRKELFPDSPVSRYIDLQTSFFSLLLIYFDVIWNLSSKSNISFYLYLYLYIYLSIYTSVYIDIPAFRYSSCNFQSR